jgi:hypothetical protein
VAAPNHSAQHTDGGGPGLSVAHAPHAKRLPACPCPCVAQKADAAATRRSPFVRRDTADRLTSLMQRMPDAAAVDVLVQLPLNKVRRGVHVWLLSSWYLPFTDRAMHPLLSPRHQAVVCWRAAHVCVCVLPPSCRPLRAAPLMCGASCCSAQGQQPGPGCAGGGAGAG